MVSRIFKFSFFGAVLSEIDPIINNRDCDAPSHNAGETWTCTGDDGNGRYRYDIAECTLTCDENYGLVDRHNVKISCNNLGEWESTGSALPACSNRCPSYVDYIGANGSHLSSQPANIHYRCTDSSLGDDECSIEENGPFPQCTDGAACGINCNEGHVFRPAVAKNNLLECSCNGVRCKWRGAGRKLFTPNNEGDARSCVEKNKLEAFGSKRIINGTDGVRGEDPYMISLGFFGKLPQGGRGWTHFCGGVLVNHVWAITAAHCQQRRLRAMIGDFQLNVREGSECLCRTTVQVRHPQYDFRTMHDIMMVGIKCRKLVFGDFIFPARLPTPATEPEDNEPCRICGWGNTQYPVYVPAHTLQCVELPIINTDICNGPNHYVDSIHSNIMCIGKLEGGQDSCQGDSGGPANCGGVIKGIVMGGLYCAKENYPGVYTKVSKYIGWMRSVAVQARRNRGRSGRGRRSIK